jgi:hypothetical protein
MARVHKTSASQTALVAALTPLLVFGAQDTGRAAANPHRPSCNSAGCRKIRSFLKAHYCGESPFGDGPDDSCDIRDPKAPNSGIDVIAHFECEWSETEQKTICHQHGQPSAEVRTMLVREMRRLGLPAADDRQTNFTVWKSKSSKWSLAEGYNSRSAGSNVTLCQAIVMIDPNSRVAVLRELPRQKNDAEVPLVTTWSLLDLTDVDGDGRPDAILRGDAYENHWIEVHSVQNGLPRMIFSGLGYYL